MRSSPADAVGIIVLVDARARFISPATATIRTPMGQAYRLHHQRTTGCTHQLPIPLMQEEENPIGFSSSCIP